MQAGGQRFDPAWLHQKNFYVFFLTENTLYLENWIRKYMKHPKRIEFKHLFEILINRECFQ